MMMGRVTTGLMAAGLLAVFTLPAYAADQIDITGRWQRYGIGANAANMAEGEKKYTPPPQPEPPLKPEYLKPWKADQMRRKEAAAAGAPVATSWAECIGSGFPGMMAAAFPMEILQSKGQVTIIQEAFTEVRRIYLGEKQVTLDDIEPGYYGNSVGHWKDGSLYVDTIGIKDYVQERNVPHSLDMEVKERFFMVSDDVLWDEITVIDPQYLTKPWVWTYAYQKMPDYHMQEYICEGNREYIDENGIQHIRLGGQ